MRRDEIVVRLTPRQAEALLDMLGTGEQRAMTPRQARAEAGILRTAEKRLAAALTRARDVDEQWRRRRRTA